MLLRQTIKAALKRGALVAAANWPVALVQATADALFKLLLAVPLVGGLVLVTLVVRTGSDPLAATDWRVMVTSLVASLLEHRLVLTAFLLSLAVVLIGGSLFMFLMKGGAVGVLVRGERQAGAVEVPPLRPEVIATASAFSIELFIASARSLFPRYARLGFVLMAVYLLSGAAYVAIVRSGIAASWEIATLATAAFVAWTTLVNLLYLMMQVVVAADDCGLRSAARRGLLFLRHDGRTVAGVFVVILALVVLASGASVLAFAALGLISIIPFMWLAAVPLQLLAFVLRAVVFQYIALSSLGAYLTLYRQAATRVAVVEDPRAWGVAPALPQERDT